LDKTNESNITQMLPKNNPNMMCFKTPLLSRDWQGIPTFGNYGIISIITLNEI
jgi:hypothetical protein